MGVRGGRFARVIKGKSRYDVHLFGNFHSPKMIFHLGVTGMEKARVDDESGSAIDQLIDLLATRVAASTRSTRAGRVTYIIGNNGTGKSRVLGALAAWLGQVRPTRTVACIANSIHDRFKYGDSGRVRYLGARNQTNAVFLSGIDRQLSRLILRAMTIDPNLFLALREAVSMDLVFRIGKDFEAQVMRLLKEPSERSRGRRSKANIFKSLGGARPMGMLRRVARGSGRFEQLTQAQIRTFLQYIELGVDIQLDVVLPDKEAFNFGQLSTGEQNRILILAKVLSTMEQGAVFLIDEPEVSLHLHWQMKFHQTLMDLLSRLTRFHVVIATHAPIIISEAAKYDPLNEKNLVAILRHDVENGATLGEVANARGEVSLETRSFAEVASHDQLVLRYFQSAPYHTREISVEIADAVLGVAEGVKTPDDAAKLLHRLENTEGLSDEARNQIREALSFVHRDLANFFAQSAKA